MEKRVLLATFVVTNTTDTTSAGSLRWAIGQSNATPGSNTIDFNIATSGVQTIAITSALPTISVPVTIDGTSEPGYTTTPLIELNGSGVGTGTNNSGIDGLDITAGSSTVKGLAINRFTGNGIKLTAAGGDTIVNSFIGTDPTGTIAEGNKLDGVLLGSNSNGDVVRKNLVSGNGDHGVELNGTTDGGNDSTSGDLVAGNLLGTDVTGKLALGNSADGVSSLNAPLATIGGTTPSARNIVSGNGAGMELYDNSDGSVIEGNYIGTDITGEVALGNNGKSGGFFNDNVVLRGISNSTIGGSVIGAGNLISGGSNWGIDSFVIGSGNLNFQGNVIGLDASQTKALGNSSGGIRIAGPSNVTIGGTVVGARNVVSGNGGDGILCQSDGAIIQGNDIGTDSSGTKSLGNGQNGLEVTNTGNLVGGFATGAANIIANNGVNNSNASGIYVSGGTKTSIISNSIFNDANLGISLNGTNNGIVAPVLTSAVSMNTFSTIVGSLNDPAGTYTLQVFSTPTLNHSGNAEGETLLGTETLTITGSSGNFTLTIPSGFTPGSVISATATDSSGDTSEFSAPIAGTGTGNGVGSPTISVSSTASTVLASQNVTETFTITNPDAVSDAGVVFYDPIPAGTTFLFGTTSTDVPVTLSGGQATAAIGSIAFNQSVTVTIELATSIAAIPSFTNTASVGATTPPLAPGIDSASITTTVEPSSDLGVTISAPTETTAVGDQLSYVVTVTNNGVSPATGVQLLDTLPAGTTYVSSSVDSGPDATSANGVLTDDYGTLAVGASFMVTINVMVGIGAYPTATDTASVSADQADPDESNNSAQASADIDLVSDVSVNISPSSTTTAVDQPLIYTITISNAGPSPASGVSFTDNLPANVNFISASASSGAIPIHSPGLISDTIGSLDAGASVVITIEVGPTVDSGTTLADSAAITTTSTDPVPSNNSATVLTSVTPVADLAVTSMTASPSPAGEGQEITFTIDVVNNGPSTATSTTLTDTLPAGLSFVSGTDPLGRVVVSNGVLTAHLGDLNDGQTSVVTIIATSTTTGTFTNTATVASPVTDPETSNNSGSATVSVSPVVDLAVTLTGDPGPIFTGTPLTYTAVVTNNGPASASNVVFTEPLFAGVTFESIESNQLFGTNNNGVATISFATLAAGASETVVLTVIPTQAEAVTETASVTSPDVDSDLGNNSASFSTAVVAPYQTIEFDSTTYTVNQSAGFAAITLSRLGDTANDVSVHFSTTSGNATPGLDYQPVNVTVDFPAGVTTATVDVPVLADPNTPSEIFVNLELDSPTGGALLQSPGQSAGSSPILAGLVIINPNPIVVGPTITDLKLTGLVNVISLIEVDTTGDLNPITANDAGNYSIIALGGPKGSLPYGMDIPVDTASYNPLTGAVTLIPSIPLPGNQFYMVGVNGQGPTAVSDLAGNPLNSIRGLTPGTDYVETVGRGTTLNYTDENGTPVTLNLTGPGTLDVDRTVSGQVTRLQVVGAVAGKTVISGSVHVKGQRTTIGSILGLGNFGSIKVKLTTPAFYVTNTVYPSPSQLTDAAAVDTLLVLPPSPKPAPVKKPSKPVKVTRTSKPMPVSVKAEAVVVSTPAQTTVLIPALDPTTTTKPKATVKIAASHPRVSTTLAVHDRKRS